MNTLKKLLIILSFLNIAQIYSKDIFLNNQYDYKKRMQFFKVPGVSLAVVNGEQGIKTEVYGYSNIAKKEAVKDNTLFQAGNISKPITALAVLKLVEDGVLDLDKDVNSYLKGWRLGRDIYSTNRKFTLRQLLSHTTGIHSQGLRGYKRGEELPEIIDILEGRGNSPKVSVHYFPDYKYRYSWGGYIVIQKIIEDVTGIGFEEYMEKNILRPLGMTNSTFKQPLPKELESSVSSGYDLFGNVIEGEWRNYPELAAAGLWSTPTDIAKYCIEIQKILTSDYEGIINKKSVETMFTKYKKGWGLGPSLKFEGEDLIFRHSGKSAGFTSYFISRPYKEESIVIMTNSDNAWKLIMEVMHSIDNYKDWGI